MAKINIYYPDSDNDYDSIEITISGMSTQSGYTSNGKLYYKFEERGEDEYQDFLGWNDKLNNTTQNGVYYQKNSVNSTYSVKFFIDISDLSVGEPQSVRFQRVYGVNENEATDDYIYNNDKKYTGTGIIFTINDFTKLEEEEEPEIPVFSWKLNSYKGTDGKTYMNNYNNKPAPVTAGEWNRFCDIAKLKGITITRATQGGNMLNAVKSASSKLGVKIPTGNKVTLQFFYDLASALNNK